MSSGATFAFALVAVLSACASAPAPAASRTNEPSAPARPRAACAHARHESCETPAPSFAREIEPLLEAHCLRCHADDGPAADEHDFSRFETLHAQAHAVEEMVGACAMPPKKSPPLSDQEADVILRWVACGAAP
jgi:hypothetical protein